MNEETIKIEDLLEALRKRWKMIVGITLIATIIAAVVSFFLIKAKYEASTKLLIGKESSESQNLNNSDVQMYQQLVKTYSEVIRSEDLVQRAIENEELDITAETIVSGLNVAQLGTTQALKISYISTDKKLAKDVVDAVTDEFIITAKDLIKNADVSIIETVKLPESPVSPNKKMNIAIAFLLGLMVGVGLAFLLEYMDNTFKTKEKLEDFMGIPVIGIIPDSDKNK